MEFAPTIDEVQQAIDGSWKAAGVNAAPPPRVIQTLVFFTPHEEREPYAIVDAHAGNCFHIGAWTIDTVSSKAPQVHSLMECRLGETVIFGPNSLLLLARNGGELPSIEECRAAVDCQTQVREHSMSLMAELGETAHLLGKHRERLETDSSNFSRFIELSRATEIVDVELSTLRSFESGLAELKQLPTNRRLVDLASEIKREAELMQLLRDDVELAVARQAETLEAHRARYNELERARVRDEQFVRAERDRVEALYREALLRPSLITQAEAIAEIKQIARLADIEGSDSFVLRRRLYVLRLRCRHSLAPPIADSTLRMLLPEIEEEIHRLKRR